MLASDKTSPKAVKRQIEKKLRLLEKKMTVAEVKFAQAYAQSHNMTAASKAAGSTAIRPDQIGYKYIKKPDVMEYIELMQEKTADLAALSGEEVINKFRDIYIRAMEEGNFKEANIASTKLGEIARVLGNKHLPVGAETKNTSVAEEKEKEDGGSSLSELVAELSNLDPDESVAQKPHS